MLKKKVTKVSKVSEVSKESPEIITSETTLQQKEHQKPKVVKIVLIVLGVLVALYGGLILWSNLTPPVLSQAVMAKTVDLAKKEAKETADIFESDASKIYCVTQITVVKGKKLTALWYHKEEKVKELSQDAPGFLPFVKWPVRAVFYLERGAEENFPTGKYSVKISVDDKELKTLEFTIIPKMETYKDEQYGFSVDYPEDWETTSGAGIIGFVSPEVVDNYRANFNVNFESLEGKEIKEVKDFMDKTEEFLEDNLNKNNYKKVSRNVMKINDLEAEILVYTWKLTDYSGNEYDLKTKLALVIDSQNPNRAFGVFCHVLEKNYPQEEMIFDNIIKSFKLG